MLPGLRFLFATTLVAASLLVFGMGAIALLRASHQQFASLTPGPPAEPVFAQRPETVPSLSMLRAEPAPLPAPSPAPPMVDPAVTTAAPAPAPQQEQAEAVVPPVPDRVASLNSAERASEPLQPASPTEITSGSKSQAAEAARDAPPAPSPLLDPAPLAHTPSAPQPENLAAAEALAAQDSPISSSPISSSPGASSPAQIAAAPQAETLAAESTGGGASPEPPQTATVPVVDPPTPEARPAAIGKLAAVAPAAPIAAIAAAPKPVVKRKPRHVARKPRVEPKVERLAPVTSAPTLGSLFGGGG